MRFLNLLVLGSLCVLGFANIVLGMESWSTFILPCSYDAKGTLQGLFEKKGDLLYGIQMPSTGVEGKLKELGFMPAEWQGTKSSIEDENTKTIVYYPFTRARTVKDPYVWIPFESLMAAKIVPQSLGTMLFSSGWSGGRTAIKVIQDGLPKKALSEDAWRVYVLPCFKDENGNVKCLLDQDKVIEIDVKGVAENDFWNADTKNTDQLVKIRLQSMFTHASFTDSDVYRDTDLKVIAYFPIVRPKGFKGDFAWKPLEEVVAKFKVGEKGIEFLKTSGWKKGKSDDEQLVEIVKRSMPIYHWLTILRAAKDGGQWYLYVRTKDNKYDEEVIRGTTPFDIGFDDFAFSKLEYGIPKTIKVIFDDGVKTDKNYTRAALDTLAGLSDEVKAGVLRVWQPAWAKDLRLKGEEKLRERLMMNFTHALMQLAA